MGFKTLVSATMLISMVGYTGSVCAQTQIDSRLEGGDAIAQSTIALDPSNFASTVAKLRSQGPSGLQAFLATYGDKLQRSSVAGKSLEDSSGDWRRLSAALDAICQQRDCYASRLYWYTDLEQAKAAAKATGKPILSLRLLGRLDEDLSCANSRFFRTALYPNAEVSKVLRDRFILHWQSVRPVPKVTINFGDGRTLERTITGNSIHYILNAEGRPIDALPGLYGPQAFLKQLERSERAVKEYTSKKGEQREEFLRQYHSDRLAANQASWKADLAKVGITSPPILVKLPDSSDNPPTAQEAAPISVTKRLVENPLVTAISAAVTSNEKALAAATDEASWNKIAQLHAPDARLDSNSKALMQRKNPALQIPTIEKFEASIALDTVRNEYQLHGQLHQWFIRGIDTTNIESLNQRVYAQLFLTPNSDPWLGLYPRDAYTAIENDGMAP